MKNFQLRPYLFWLCALLCMQLLALPAIADFPNKSVQMVLPVGVGGGTDALARQLAKKLSEYWGQPVVVDNKTGAGGIIAAQAVSRASPDGHTIFFSHDGVITATPVLYNRPDYDPITQLAPISMVSRMSYLVVVHPSVPAKNITELIAAMKEKSAKKQPFTFATSALGSADHLSGEQFKTAAGVEMLVVPYKSSLPAMTDVIGGHLPFGFFTIPGTLPHVRTGALRLVGVTSSKRSSLFPDVATVGESIPGYVTGAWYGLWAPVGTPAAVIDKIGADVKRAMNAPDMTAYLLQNGFEGETSSPAEFAEFIKKDSASTAAVIKRVGVKLQ